MSECFDTCEKKIKANIKLIDFCFKSVKITHCSFIGGYVLDYSFRKLLLVVRISPLDIGEWNCLFLAEQT